MAKLLCRLGLHGYPRSQGVVGYCSRGCGDLKLIHVGEGDLDEVHDQASTELAPLRTK